MIERGSGKVWDGVNGGAYSIVDTDDDYLFVVTLDSSDHVPTTATSYSGVPVHYALASQ